MNKTHTTNYYDSFIRVAEDYRHHEARIPVEKNGNKSVALLQFEMLISRPYHFTSDDVVFQTYAINAGIPEGQWNSERESFFSKGQPCMRCSPLTKSYGWGVHSNSEGKIAIYPIGSDEYVKMFENQEIKQIRAMKTSR
jgi:hypothetical protein